MSLVIRDIQLVDFVSESVVLAYNTSIDRRKSWR